MRQLLRKELILLPFLIIGHFNFLYIVFIINLDIQYIYIHVKSYIALKVKTNYNFKQSEQKLKPPGWCGGAYSISVGGEKYFFYFSYGRLH